MKINMKLPFCSPIDFFFSFAKFTKTFGWIYHCLFLKPFLDQQITLLVVVWILLFLMIDPFNKTKWWIWIAHCAFSHFLSFLCEFFPPFHSQANWLPATLRLLIEKIVDEWNRNRKCLKRKCKWSTRKSSPHDNFRVAYHMMSEPEKTKLDMIGGHV